MNGVYVPNGTCGGFPQYVNGAYVISLNNGSHAAPTYANGIATNYGWSYWLIGNASLLDCGADDPIGFTTLSSFIQTFPVNLYPGDSSLFWNTGLDGLSSIRGWAAGSSAGSRPPSFVVECIPGGSQPLSPSPLLPSPSPPPPPPVTAEAMLGDGVESGFCVTVSGRWDRGSPGEGKWQTVFEVDGLHGEIYSWDGDHSLWRNNSEIRITNHNDNSLHCVFTAFLVPSNTSAYGSWPPGTDKTIRFCVKPNGKPMLPFDVTSNKSFQHMKFSIVKPASFVPNCRKVFIGASTPFYLGHNQTYEASETDHFVDYYYDDLVSHRVSHSAFYGCLRSMRLNTIGNVPTPSNSSLGSVVAHSTLTGSLGSC